MLRVAWKNCYNKYPKVEDQSPKIIGEVKTHDGLKTKDYNHRR